MPEVYKNNIICDCGHKVCKDEITNVANENIVTMVTFKCHSCFEPKIIVIPSGIFSSVLDHMDNWRYVTLSIENFEPITADDIIKFSELDFDFNDILEAFEESKTLVDLEQFITDEEKLISLTFKDIMEIDPKLITSLNMSCYAALTNQFQFSLAKEAQKAQTDGKSPEEFIQEITHAWSSIRKKGTD